MGPSALAAQGLPEVPKKPTPTQQRIDEGYARGFADGVAAGKQMAYAEIEAKQRLSAMQHPSA